MEFKIWSSKLEFIIVRHGFIDAKMLEALRAVTYDT